MNTVNDFMSRYGEYSDLVGMLVKYIKSKDNILMVGCGNSTLGPDLYDIQNCHNQVNIDLNATIIRQMAAKYTGRPGLQFRQADATKLNESFSASQFTCAIDKGTLDAIYSAENDQCQTAARTLLHQVN